MDRPVQITRIPRMEFHKTVSELFDRRLSQLLPTQIPLEKISAVLSEAVTTGDGVEIPECGTCGACCAVGMVVYIPRSNTAEIGNVWEIALEDSPTDVTTGRVVARNMETGNCSSLSGEVGSRVSCANYEGRPTACSEFEAGSDKCHEYRRMYGIEPQLSEDELAEIMPRVMDRVRPEKVIFARIIRDSMAYEYSLLEAAETNQRPQRSEKLRIEVVLSDENYSLHEIHVYDPLKETWFESDFLGLSLERARELVAPQQSETP